MSLKYIRHFVDNVDVIIYVALIIFIVLLRGNDHD